MDSDLFYFDFRMLYVIVTFYIDSGSILVDSHLFYVDSDMFHIDSYSFYIEFGMLYLIWTHFTLIL